MFTQGIKTYLRTFLKIIAWIFLNLLMICIAAWIYGWLTLPIIRITESADGIQGLFGGVIIFFGLLVFFLNKSFRRFGIGLIAISLYGSIFLFYFINQSISFRGEYVTYRLSHASWSEEKYELDVAFYHARESVAVTAEKCLSVDSVDVRIDKGLFGMRVITDDVRLVENHDYPFDDIDSSEFPDDPLSVAHQLAKKRCFSVAIQAYSNCIRSDSFVPGAFYNRGLMHMALKDYNKALRDFYAEAFFQYQELDQGSLDLFDSSNYASMYKEFEAKVKKEDYRDIHSYLEKMEMMQAFETYQARILFCLKKLEESNRNLKSDLNRKPSLNVCLDVSSVYD